MAQARIGIIGGSGLYKMEGLTQIEEINIDTPFGKPSDSITLGTLEGQRVAFLPRHGRGHRIMPTNLPVRANIYALKTLGVERIVSVSAVGSLQEEFRPLDLVVPHQLIDRTYHRESTFFDKDVVAHIAFSDPFCPVMSDLLYKTASATGTRVHPGGTMVVMEGPAFSTRAESHMYRRWGADIIGMTALPEAKLAREAEICYATLACVTDYDCWREATEVVTVEMVVANLLKNVSVSQRVLKDLIPKMPKGRNCGCGEALKDAIITAREQIPAGFKKKMAPIIGKYVK
jgi:5'-methylthioadenosine phosphorylase